MTEQTEGDVEIPPVNMAQTMSILANAVHATILANFVKPDDPEYDKVTLTYVCLAVFLHQLCTGAKHKDKMIGTLEAVTEEIRLLQAEEVAEQKET